MSQVPGVTAIHDKVVGGGIGYAISQVIIWLTETLSKVDIPFAVESAIGFIFVFGAGYFVPETKPATAGPHKPDEAGGYSWVELLVGLAVFIIVCLLLLKLIEKL